MNKLLSLSILLITLSLIFVNCTKEGPVGPAGSTGATGAPGPAGPGGPAGGQGPAGTANVIYSPWFTLTGWHDSTMTDQGLCKVAYRDAPGITATILSNGVVLSYSAPSSTSTWAAPLPWLVTSTNPNIIIGFRPATSRIVYYNTQTNSAAGGIILTSTYVFRYVIIPGGVAGGRLSNGAGMEPLYNGYSESQLRNMTYTQIAQLFNLHD